ncbi:hypothetical protein Peur_018641 [Populus x canadensis]
MNISIHIIIYLNEGYNHISYHRNGFFDFDCYQHSIHNILQVLMQWLLEAGNLLGTASATSFIHLSIYLFLKNQPQHQLDIHSSESKLSLRWGEH